MKLVQLNVWAGRLEFQLDHFLQAEKPDIVCLQEAVSFDKSPGTGFFLTTDAIQNTCQLKHIAFSPILSFGYMGGVARFGNGILSRLPITESETVFTHLEHKSDFVWGGHSSNIRNFVHAVVEVDGKSCHVLTHHGYWISEHKNGNETTTAQMHQLTTYIKKLKGPIILTGDFNLVPGSESLKELNHLLSNLSVEYGLKTTRTSLTKKTEVCDYIFVNDEVKVKSFKASDEVVSDHQALILEFNI